MEMRLHVSFERERVRELSVTDVADVRPVGAVRGNVASDVMWQRELPTTQRTGKWTAVTACMTLQAVRLQLDTNTAHSGQGIIITLVLLQTTNKRLSYLTQTAQ